MDSALPSSPSFQQPHQSWIESLLPLASQLHPTRLLLQLTPKLCKVAGATMVPRSVAPMGQGCRRPGLTSPPRPRLTPPLRRGLRPVCPNTCVHTSVSGDRLPLAPTITRLEVRNPSSDGISILDKFLCVLLSSSHSFLILLLQYVYRPFTYFLFTPTQNNNSFCQVII
jgi:hypothetical protein